MFYKQVDGWAMGGSLSVSLSDIYMAKMEDDVEKYQNTFYKRYVQRVTKILRSLLVSI